jgi:hypothetical protein
VKFVVSYLPSSFSFSHSSTTPTQSTLSSVLSKSKGQSFKKLTKYSSGNQPQGRKLMINSREDTRNRFSCFSLSARTQNEVEDELADLLGNDDEYEVSKEKQSQKSNFLSADKSKPSKLPASARGSPITGDDYIDESDDDYKPTSIEENDSVDILSMFRNLNKADEKPSEYEKPKSIDSAGKGKKGPQYDLISEQRLKDEIISPYKNNWILFILITMFSLVFFGYLFPEELFQIPSIPVPDL